MLEDSVGIHDNGFTDTDSFISSFSFLGSTFICNTHIIPVKNQDGVAMMFIINFEYVLDEENVESPEKFTQILSAKVTNRKCDYYYSGRELWDGVHMRKRKCIIDCSNTLVLT